MTGATGFLGGRLAEALVRCGARPLLLVRDPAKVAPALVEHVDIIRGDVRDLAALVEATKGVDAVFHCAAVTTNKAPASVHEEINVEATGLVVQAAGEAGARRVVHASSVVVYGVDPPGRVVNEETPLDRSVGRWDHYLRTKVAAETVARERAARFDGLEVAIVRLGILYGPGRPLSPGIMPIGPFQLLMGGGRNRLPYTYVGDAVDAMLLAAIVDEAADQAYNVVGEVPLSVRAVVSAGEGGIRRARPIGVPRPAARGGTPARATSRRQRLRGPPTLVRVRGEERHTRRQLRHPEGPLPARMGAVDVACRRAATLVGQATELAPAIESNSAVMRRTSRSREHVCIRAPSEAESAYATQSQGGLRMKLHGNAGSSTVRTWAPGTGATRSASGS